MGSVIHSQRYYIVTFDNFTETCQSVSDCKESDDDNDFDVDDDDVLCTAFDWNQLIFLSESYRV